jgi:HEAT repeat protein
MLEKVRPPPPEAVNALMIALKDESVDVRSAAASTPQKAGGEAECEIGRSFVEDCEQSNAG